MELESRLIHERRQQRPIPDSCNLSISSMSSIAEFRDELHRERDWNLPSLDYRSWIHAMCLF
jgi:hypothetical protein